MGNHEDLMLKAIRDSGAVDLWLVNGGSETLRSYGADPRQWAASADRGAFLEKDRAFVEGLELYVEDDKTIYVHAGIDVREPDMTRQKRQVLLWIREPFFRAAGAWKGKEVIFGHTPTRTMGLPHDQIFRNRAFIGIDTGCVYGGVLTAIHSRTHALYQERSGFRYR
jgi:serine/threonine protein phosphatase 1